MRWPNGVRAAPCQRGPKPREGRSSERPDIAKCGMRIANRFTIARPQSAVRDPQYIGPDRVYTPALLVGSRTVDVVHEGPERGASLRRLGAGAGWHEVFPLRLHEP